MEHQVKTKVIVTGGAGFIGSHLAEALVERGFDVHVIDNLSEGKREQVPAGAELHVVDICDFEKLLLLLTGAKFLFHLAAIPRVERSLNDPRTTHETNVTGTLNVLLASRAVEIKRVIYASSSSVYGNKDALPLKEDMAAEPLSPYALQKLLGELQCAFFSRLYGLETVALRYFNVYGPRAPGQGVYALAIPKFLAARRQGQALTITGDGTQSRDFTHVRDIVRANLLAAVSSNVGKGEVINIGSGHNRTVLEVAELIGGPRVFIEPRIEPKHTLADIAKAQELLGWEPKESFEEGIRELEKTYGLAPGV